MLDSISMAFDSSTDRQHEALSLAARHYSSKEIAFQLGISIKAVDRRIDSVRDRLEGIPRAAMLRHYRDWLAAQSAQNEAEKGKNPPAIDGANEKKEQGESSPLTPDNRIEPEGMQQPGGYAFAFEDITLPKRNGLETRVFSRLLPKISELGKIGKLMVILLGTATFLAAGLLCLVCVHTLSLYLGFPVVSA